MRSKKALINTIASLILQIVTIICGFIVPKLIIETYGSGINGAISSITQFLGIIILLESGIGGIVRASLYKPLAFLESKKVSGIIIATEKYFRVISYIFIGYTLTVAIFFPFFVREELDIYFTSILVVIIGLSTFIQYYFGITYQLLLQADQRRYVTSSIQLVTIVINTIVIAILISIGSHILVVKLCSSLIFVIRPIIVNNYVKKYYKIDKNIEGDQNAIKQRWDGLGHHIAYFLQSRSDIILLTLFTNVKIVSVYSLYYMVVSGIQSIAVSFSSGVEAAFGNIIAKNDKKILNINFRAYELLSYIMTTVLFSCVAIFILPFMAVYTHGVNDISYIRPQFAYVLILATAIYCIRLPYHYVTLAAGHFKQTRNGAFLEAGINIFLSISLVNSMGLTGVAVGTLCAVSFRTFQYARYISKNILERGISEFVVRCFVNIVSVTIIIYFSRKVIEINNINTLIDMISLSTLIILISLSISIFINAIFYYKDVKTLISVTKNILSKGKMIK